MKVLTSVVLVILTLLAISSGVAKMMLMQQDVAFFSQYGFTSPMLIIYGVIQLIGGALLVLRRTRVVGAIVVGITFLVSLVLLLMAENYPIAIVTLVCVVLLGFVIRQQVSKKYDR